MALLIIPLIILIALTYGGWRLIRELSVVKVLSIRGGLFALVCFCRYGVYAAGLAVFIVVFAITFVPESNRSLSIDHEFSIHLDENIYTINQVGKPDEPGTLRSISGSIDIGATQDSLLLVVAAVGTLLLVVLHQLFRHAESVFLSLYQRVPFTIDNALHTKKIAELILAVWFIYYAYMVGMTYYLTSRLETSGFTVSLTDLPWLPAFFTAGVVFVLSEVFRVGHELKEEQDYTV